MRPLRVLDSILTLAGWDWLIHVEFYNIAIGINLAFDFWNNLKKYPFLREKSGLDAVFQFLGGGGGMECRKKVYKSIIWGTAIFELSNRSSLKQYLLHLFDEWEDVSVAPPYARCNSASETDALFCLLWQNDIDFSMINFWFCVEYVCWIFQRQI